LLGPGDVDSRFRWAAADPTRFVRSDRGARA